MYFVLRYLTAQRDPSTNQVGREVQILTYATPTMDNGFNLLPSNIPEKSVSLNLNFFIRPVT